LQQRIFHTVREDFTGERRESSFSMVSRADVPISAALRSRPDDGNAERTKPTFARSVNACTGQKG
jgi:hypothetical protein